MDAQSDLQGSAANGNRPSPATHVSATVRLEFKAPDWLPRTSSHELRKARAGTQGAQTRQLWVLEHNSKREVPVVPPPFPHSALHPIGQGYRKPGPRMGVQKASISCDPARQGFASRLWRQPVSADNIPSESSRLEHSARRCSGHVLQHEIRCGRNFCRKSKKAPFWIGGISS